MKTNPPALHTTGLVLLLMSAVALNQTAPSILAKEGHKVGVASGGKAEGSSVLPAYRTDRTHPAFAAVAAAAPSTNGLVGWWKLDETAGTVASDSSGNGHNGTLLNGPVWSAGQVRGALSFDGTNDQVRCPDSPALRISGDLTIAFWKKKNAESRQAVCLVGKASSSLRNYVVWEEAGSDGRLLFQQTDAKGQGINLWTSGKLAVGTWYHFAAVVRGNNVSLYVNGKFDGSKMRGIAAPTTEDPLTFGYSGWNDHYSGVLDEVRIYNRALTAEEVTALHAEASPDRRRASR